MNADTKSKLEKAPFEPYRWQEGIQFDEEPKQEAVSDAKEAFSDLCDGLTESVDLPREFRITSKHYELEVIPVYGGLSINHFRVYTREEGVGSHVIEELERVARAHDHDTVSIWIGANGDGETKAFLDSLGYEVVAKSFDEAHGRTVEAEKEL